MSSIRIQEGASNAVIKGERVSKHSLSITLTLIKPRACFYNLLLMRAAPLIITYYTKIKKHKY